MQPHLVLSGGLGNSAYVYQRLRDRYAFGNSPFPNARSLQVKVAPEPQMVVCKGIVADRVQKLKTGKSVLGWRCSRASYGTLAKVLYNPQNSEHFGRTPVRDNFDGKLYILECISWFIKEVTLPLFHKCQICDWNWWLHRANPSLSTTLSSRSSLENVLRHLHLI